MRSFQLSHVHDSVLLRELTSLVERDRAELHLSEASAYKRIRAARAAREFPALLRALAEGRLHVSAVCLLAPHLAVGNVDELIVAATHKGRAELEQWLAQRFPIAEALRLDDGVFPVPAERLVPVEFTPGRVETAELAPGRVEVPSPPTRLSPLSPERYTIQVTIPAATHDKLRHAQALLGHAIPSGDIAGVLDRALDSLICQLEKRRLGATKQPHRHPRTTRGPRHIPAAVRRAVWERDRGECTFVGDNGHRCGARMRLEFDHVDPIARGGRATVERMRLRCRAHNQFEAERAFGEEFMRRKRAAAGRPAGAASDRPISEADSGDQAADVIAGPRAFGLRASEARHVAEASRPDHPVSLEERLRLALRAHRPRGTMTTGVRAPAPAVGQPDGPRSRAPVGP